MPLPHKISAQSPAPSLSWAQVSEPALALGAHQKQALREHIVP